MALEVRDEHGNDRDVPILGMAADSDWILYAPYSDKSLMRNVLAYGWSNAIGLWAPRTRFVEVYLQTDAGRVLDEHYQGL